MKYLKASDVNTWIWLINNTYLFLGTDIYT